MTVDEVVLFIAVNVFEVEIIRRSMIIFLQKPQKKFSFFFSYFLRFITSVITHGLDNHIIEIAIGAITLGFIEAQYNGSIKKRISSFAFTFALIYLCDLVVGLFFEPSTNGSPNVGVLIISKLLGFMIVMITKKLIGSKRESISNNAEISAAVLVPITTAALEAMLIFSTESVFIVITSAVIVLFLNIFVFYMYDKISENYRQKAALAKAEQEKEIYYNQCINLVNSQDTLRQFRHDINNQLEMANILLDKGDTEELKGQLQDILSSGHYYNEPICFTGNVAVDGILNYKLDKIRQFGAEIETELAVPCQSFMSTKDLTLILGNLLDNIIDAFASMQSRKYCFVQVKYSKSRLLIQLKNTYESALLFENGRIVSSKSDDEPHGIGLKSVREVAEKYNGCMEIGNNDGLFFVKMILLIPLGNALE